MTLRLFVSGPLQALAQVALPEAAARHAKVRRVQPGDDLLLFDGLGLDWPAQVLAVTRSGVSVCVGQPRVVDTELRVGVTVALVMPANERMDLLVEKATELGVALIQPLHSVRSVLRLGGERGARKRAHWQAIAQAACEQCGRAVVPQVAPARDLQDWLQDLAQGRLQPTPPQARWLLSAPRPDQAGRPPWGSSNVAKPHVLESLRPPARSAAAHPWPSEGLCTLSGPEGGFTPEEEAAAHAAGFEPVALGPRVLRAETAPLAVLAWLALSQPIPGDG